MEGLEELHNELLGPGGAKKRRVEPERADAN
jgi:hypothetical protein